MYRLQVWFGKRWKWGIKSYATMEDAKKRVEELKRVGIRAKVMESNKLFD